MLLLASDNQALRKRWVDALANSGVRVEALAPQRLAERLAAGGVEVCLVDLGAHQVADHGPLLDLLQRFADVPFVALVAIPSVAQGVALLQAGVRGYCNRLAAAGLIPVVVQTVQAGELWVGRQVAQHLLARPAPVDASPQPDLLTELTPRELEIAQMVGEGLSNKLIAKRSGITERTVKAHLNAIFRKTGIRNRVQLALAAAQTDRSERELARA